MTEHATPFVPETRRPGLRDRVVRWCLGAAIRVSLLVSPRPTALLIRRVFAAGGATTRASLDRHAPTGTETVLDVRYGEEPEMVLDIVRPVGMRSPAPLILWIHGGGWIGGSKAELTGWFKLIAAGGYVVAGPDYGLAPEHHYPTPPRHTMAALAFLVARAEQFGFDPARIVIAGDSAGAHVAAQIGALVTTPGYATAVGVVPSIAADQLRGLVLACGPYDLGLTRDVRSPAGRRFIHAVIWSYTGTRTYLDDPRAATWSVTDHLTRSYPPTLITVGDADPLRPHSERLADRLRELGVVVETVFWPVGGTPSLGHEYQFDLDTEAAQRFLLRLFDFLGERSVGGDPASGAG